MRCEKSFDCCLKDALIAAGVEREELAQHLGVVVPVVNRWLNGSAIPDVNQFREIARYLDVSYARLLGGNPDTFDTAERLGLSEDTVACLLELVGDGDDENEAVLAAVDDAIQAVLGAVCAVHGRLLPLTEELARIAEDALALTNTNVKEGR